MFLLIVRVRLWVSVLMCMLFTCMFWCGRCRYRVFLQPIFSARQGVETQCVCMCMPPCACVCVCVLCGRMWVEKNSISVSVQLITKRRAVLLQFTWNRNQKIGSRRVLQDLCVCVCVCAVISLQSTHKFLHTCTDTAIMTHRKGG